MSNKDIEINNYTHLKGDNAVEVLLIGVSKDFIGFSNKISPDFFKKTHITTWMRSNYNITSSRIIAQIPRKMREFPQIARDQFDYNVDKSSIRRILSDENETKFCYSIEKTDKYVILYWDLKNDKWRMRIKDISEDYMDEYAIWS
jgi:hypothetical protein